MGIIKKTSIILLFLSLLCSQGILGIDTKDTRMLSQPAISSEQIAFIYAEDLWAANLDGTQPRRITVDEGIESNPVFSPDGKLIAFSAEYDGNTDVFIVPVEGGIPSRLTWHPGNDFVRGFTPDGSEVLFISQRDVFTNRYFQLFTVPVAGGFPKRLEIPNAFHADYSPDGMSMAYTPLGDRFRQWKHYRGGTIARIWLFSFLDHSFIEIPKPEGGCNDSYPMWIGDRIYFLSDRAGEFNLFSYDVADEHLTQLTSFEDFPVLSASSGSDKILFEQAGYLHSYDLESGTAEKITIGIAADLQELRTRYVRDTRYIRSAHISPSGVRAVFDFRGDIITVPAEKGDPRNLTLTTGVHEKFPAWSPDGKSVAYFSDASGEYALHIIPQDSKGEPLSYPLKGTGFYAFPEWSPDSKKICYVDNGRSLYLLDIASDSITKIDSDDLYRPGEFRKLFGDWSFDSKWFVYTKLTETHFQRVYLYSLEQGKSYIITDGMSDVTEPVFDSSGKYLYFFASTDAGPVINWFDQSNMDMNMSRSIYLVTLQKDTISPFVKESDEEEISEQEEAERTIEKKKKDKKVDTDEKPEDKNVQIDLEGIQNRIVDFPVKAGNYSNLGASKEGEIMYIDHSADNPGSGTLHVFSLKDREDKEITEMDYYVVSADGKKMLYRKKNTWGISATGKKPEEGKGILGTDQLQVKIDPQSEWSQIFNEAWRINRDYFYDPGMHGADWPEMKEKYAQFLPHLSCRNDLNRIIQWMCSELSVGHHRVGGGAKLNNPPRVTGGLLGAEIVVDNNRYRIEKIFQGLNWNPKLRSPLTEPGININDGEYILAVNGKDVTSSENFHSFFENTAGKIVELRVGPTTDYAGSRLVKVVPLRNEYALRNRNWVEGNVKKVHKATNGEVAYVYVPNTSYTGHEYFKRYFFPQANKKAIIIDERFNGGGSIADYYIDILRRPYQSHWNMRFGKDLKTPSASIQGPKVMIINETAGSGGDMLPWMFRKFNMGTLVGKRTWGGLVGTLGFPELIDGGYITAPNLAIWTEEGFIVENVGVPPDVEVEQWPVEIIKGNDPQLEKAIEIIMKQLEENPQVDPIKPPYPIRAN